MRFFISLVTNALGLWIVTLILAPHVLVKPYDNSGFSTVVTYLFIALIFGLVNGIIGTIVRIVAFPLYILTLGLLALVVNALLLLLTSAISNLFGFGLYIENFWWGLWGAFLLSVISWVLGLIFRPFRA